MTNEIDVKFDKMSYAPGETLHGKIVLIIMKETHADRVDFSIVTNENQWALFSAKKPTEYDADKKSVAQVPGGVLQPGYYELDFEYELYKKAQQTMQVDQVVEDFFSMRTTVTIDLVGPNKNDEMSITKPLHIHESPNPAKIAVIDEKQEMQAKCSMACFWDSNKANDTQLHLQVGRNVIGSKEVLSANVSVDNTNGKVGIKHVQLKVIQKICNRTKTKSKLSKEIFYSGWV